jgi:hypothetical protein
MTLVYTQRCLTNMFMFSHSLHCIDSCCKVVHMVMDLIKMNYCWGGPKDRVVLLDLWQLWQITRPNHPWQIAFRTLKEKRFLYAKWLANCPPNVDKDSHQPNFVNFSHPRITIHVIEPNMVEDVLTQ